MKKKWLISIFMLAFATSCTDYFDEVYSISNQAYGLYHDLYKIGERSIPDYHTSGLRYYRFFNSELSGDSIVMSAEEFRDLQNEIFDIYVRLDKLASKMVDP